VLLVCALALTSAVRAAPQGVRVSGRVIDSASRKPIPGALVRSSSGSRDHTDRHGAFELLLREPGYEVFEVKKRGYLPGRFSLEIPAAGAPELLFEIERLPEVKERVVVRAEREAPTEPVQIVPPETVRTIPGGGEDALQAIKYLPGVLGGDDWSARLYVRGGRPDQNGIYLDGIPIYDPYRLFGLTSLSNPETLESIVLYPGGFDVRYGDRLSAVIEVENRNGTTERRFASSANLNLTNTNLVAEGSLGLGFPASWLFTFRRTYYDLLLRYLADEGASFPAFTDVQGRIYLQPWEDHYWTITMIGCKEGTRILGREVEVGEQKDEFDAQDDQRDYVLGLRGVQRFGERLTLRYVVARTRNEQVSDFEFRESETGFVTGLDQNLVNEVDSLRPGMELRLGRHTLMLGGEAAQSANTVTFHIRTDDPRWQIPDDMFAFDNRQEFRKYGAYLQDLWEPLDGLEVKLGARRDRSTLSGMVTVSPRASLRRRFASPWEVRAAWGYYYQFPSYESLQGDGYFLDLRGIKDLHLRPERAIHYLLGGAYHAYEGWTLAVDAYYKDLDDLLDSDEEQQTILILDENDREREYTRDFANLNPVNSRRGYARGVDVTFTLLEGPDRPVHGMLAYTWGEARSRDADGWRVERRDQRHTLTLIAGVRLGKYWELGLKWRFGSGFPYTPVTNVIRVVADLDGDGKYEPEDGEFFTYQRDEPDEVIYSRRYPPYHRLDLRIDYARTLRGIDWTFYLDVINAYDRKNVFDYTYSEDFSRRAPVYGMPFLPSAGVKARF
jgi:hypothetical protein